MKWRLIYILASFFILTNSYASQLAVSNFEYDGDAIGNGGDGLFLSDNKFVLLDLVEEGVERDPYFDESMKVDPSILERAQQKFSAYSINEELVARKLTEIKTMDPILSELLLQAMEMYSWQFTNYPLRNVSDEGTWVDAELYQIAIRSLEKIIINETLFRKLDEKNQVALIFHEVVYALIKPQKLSEAGDVDFFYQRSVIARSINGYLFTENLSSSWLGLKQRAKTFLPLVNNDGLMYQAKSERYMTETLLFRDGSHRRAMAAKRLCVYNDRNEERKIKIFKYQHRINFSEYLSSNSHLTYLKWQQTYGNDSEYFLEEKTFTIDADPGDEIFRTPFDHECAAWLLEKWEQFKGSGQEYDGIE